MTDWKPTMLTASAPSGEMMTWINPSAIEQLQREVDALKVKAAPTPVEDEGTEAGDESPSSYEPASSDIPDEMIEAGHLAVLDASRRNLYSKAFAAQVYTAMRLARPATQAARVPAPTPEPSGDWRAGYDAEHARAERLAAVVRAGHQLIFTRGWSNEAFEPYARAHDALHPGDTEEAK